MHYFDWDEGCFIHVFERPEGLGGPVWGCSGPGLGSSCWGWLLTRARTICRQNTGDTGRDWLRMVTGCASLLSVMSDTCDVVMWRRWCVECVSRVLVWNASLMGISHYKMHRISKDTLTYLTWHCTVNKKYQISWMSVGWKNWRSAFDFPICVQISWFARHTRKRRKEWEILNFRKEIVSLMKLYFIICLWEKKRMKEGRDFCLGHSNFRHFKANKRNVLDDRTLLREFSLVFGIIALCWYEVSTKDFHHFCFPCFLWHTPHTDLVPDLMRSENLMTERVFQNFKSI